MQEFVRPHADQPFGPLNVCRIFVANSKTTPRALGIPQESQSEQMLASPISQHSDLVRPAASVRIRLA
jgi:hypothetical protein